MLGQGVPAVRSFQKRYMCPTESMPATSRVDLPWPRLSPQWQHCSGNRATKEAEEGVKYTTPAERSEGSSLADTAD